MSNFCNSPIYDPNNDQAIANSHSIYCQNKMDETFRTPDKIEKIGVFYCFVRCIS